MAGTATYLLFVLPPGIICGYRSGCHSRRIYKDFFVLILIPQRSFHFRPKRNQAIIRRYIDELLLLYVRTIGCLRRIWDLVETTRCLVGFLVVCFLYKNVSNPRIFRIFLRLWQKVAKMPLLIRLFLSWAINSK